MQLSFFLIAYAQIPSTPSLADIKANGFKTLTFPGPPGNDPCFIQTTLNWTSPAGTFRTNVSGPSVPCSAGYWCPENTFLPEYCCPGFVCSPNGDTIKICPKQQYCPTGSIEGQPCSGVASCSPGTVKPVRIGLLVIIFIILLMISFGFNFKKRWDIQESIRTQIILEQVKQDKLEPKTIPTTSRKQNQSFNIEYDNLEFKLPDGTTIMKNVSGVLRVGTMTAVMGPSGAGKSTFFSLLTGKTKRSNGVVRINGKKEELTKYKKLLGFVPQDDIMLKELTVNDILGHSASMRLNADLSKEQIATRVAEIINYLGMSHVANTIIGDEETRGISGGQRKRVNIGMEIVADPSVLFLDEPTSGLDSSTSLELCQILSKLAKDNKMTIAAVIHSPSPETFFEFDDLLLLAKGGVVAYFGPANHVAKYFKELGFDRPSGQSAADFAMDVVSGKVECSWDPDFKPQDLALYWDNYIAGTPIEKREECDSLMGNIMKPNAIKMTLFAKIMASLMSMFLDFKEWAIDISTEFAATVTGIVRTVSGHKDSVRVTPNIVKMFILLLKRTFKQQFRSAKIFIFDSVIHFVAGLMVSVAIENFQYLGKQPQQACELTFVKSLFFFCSQPVDSLNQAGMLISVGILFAGQATSSYTFGNEKVVYWRDTCAGMPTISYFLAKFVSDIPRIIIAAIFYTLSVTIFFDYRSKFVEMLLINLALYFVAFNFGYFISIVFNKSSVALLTAANSLLWGFVFGGVSPSLDEVYSTDPGSNFKGWKWLWDISAPRWSIEAIYIKETAARPWIELKNEDLLHQYEKNNFGFAISKVFQIGVLWAFLSYLALKLTNRQKQK